MGAELTIVVPAYNAAAELPVLLANVGDTPVIVVDDASTDDTSSVAASLGARVVRVEVNAGPANARNVGWRAAATPYVVFVDADASVPERPAAFRDRGVGLIGPRIRPRMTDKPNITERYDAATSVYDLGDAGGAVGPDEPVRYLTSAVLFARVEALQAVDGFDASMRFGEDLDLVSRLRAAGWTASYDPSVEATHACRRSFHKLLRLHFNYNRPHGELSRRHGENRGVGRLGIRTLLNAITGPWLVPLLVLSIWFPTLPVAMLLLLFGRYYLEWRDKLPYMSPITWTVMRLLDSQASAAGLWWGSLRAGTLAPLLPRLR